MKDKKKELINKAKTSKIEEAKIESVENEKKGLYAVLIIFVILIMFAIVWLFTDKTTTMTDAKKFEKEYEQLNNKSNENTGIVYYEINVLSNNPIKYATNDEIIEVLENKTGVIYFGFPECPWCRNLVPNLISAAKEAGIAKIYYLNNKENRDTKTLDEDGNIITEKEGTKDYYKILDLLGDKASIYEGLNDDNIKRLYYPTVVFVKDGKIIDIHVGTLDSQTDVTIPLTDDQKTELINTLKEKMEKIIICDSAC